MSTERLREMLSEATPGPWVPTLENTIRTPAGTLGDSERGEGRFKPSDAALVALAPDAIALLADFADAVTDRRQDGTFRDDKIQAVLLRLDALCGDER